jgi:hypothetical protein
VQASSTTQQVTKTRLAPTGSLDDSFTAMQFLSATDVNGVVGARFARGTARLEDCIQRSRGEKKGEERCGKW